MTKPKPKLKSKRRPTPSAVPPNGSNANILRIEYVPLDDILLWDRNPKMHDIGALLESIWRYGFVDEPKYDAALGAIVFGNGRLMALAQGRAAGREPPRGIKLDPGGAWLVPIKFGVDQSSSAEAEALGVDHNNLTMAGGDFTAIDMARAWNGQYLDLLRALADQEVRPVTVSDEALAALAAAVRHDLPPGEFTEFGDDIPIDHVCPKCGYRWSGGE